MADLKYSLAMELSDRLAQVDRCLLDPPLVHRNETLAWSTAASAYRFLAEASEPPVTTLETGLGVSTVLFASWGAKHTCVIDNQRQVDIACTYMSDRGIDFSNVTFEVGSSTDLLPRMDIEELDIFLIDGGHHFPLPLIDWYYGAQALKKGGLLLVDDTNLPGVRLGLIEFLTSDPMWERVSGTQKWLAYRRISEGPLTTADQPFLQSRFDILKAERFIPEPIKPVVKRLAARAKLL